MVELRDWDRVPDPVEKLLVGYDPNFESRKCQRRVCERTRNELPFC